MTNREYARTSAWVRLFIMWVGLLLTRRLAIERGYRLCGSGYF